MTTTVSGKVPERILAGHNLTRPSDNFTRPNNTTAYGAGDLVANSATAGLVAPLEFASAARENGGTGAIRAAVVRKSDADTANATFDLHIFTTSPTVQNGDNDALVPDDKDTWIGSLSITVGQAFNDGAAGRGAPGAGQEINFACAAADTSLYGLLEATGAYSPAANEVFTIEIEIHQD